MKDWKKVFGDLSYGLFRLRIFMLFFIDVFRVCREMFIIVYWCYYCYNGYLIIGNKFMVGKLERYG